MTEAIIRKSDLGVRTLSAIVMLAVAGVALWLGGWAWTLLVVLVAAGVLWEWQGLVRGFVISSIGRTVWLLFGVGYVGLATLALVQLRGESAKPAFLVVSAVIATDIGAYFVGRSVGGPKIAPSISPSKTWAGLAGGMLAAGLSLAGYLAVGWYDLSFPYEDVSMGALALIGALLGGLTAIIAQAGDFFESWMKRRASAKDSGNLIPGHGGVFDRVDGLLAVCFAIGLVIIPYRTLIAVGFSSSASFP
jgi:phosphatidate cytidylyltransferase